MKRESSGQEPGPVLFFHEEAGGKDHFEGNCAPDECDYPYRMRDQRMYGGRHPIGNPEERI
ncbi:hypothetical protein BSZ35_15020 [Salinibacter sp. 10B]|nr:hypothetical protein BSZ35_15020 [Salinibacter sp. 10B]